MGTPTRGQLSVAFYRGSSNEPLINRITQMWTGDFVHCELVFVDPKSGRNMACGVWQDETVFLRPKTFGRDTWTWRTIDLPEVDLQKARAFCQKQATNNCPFNKSGLVRCTTPFPRPTCGSVWFCSELGVSALQQAGLLLDLMPSATTPTDLYELLGALGSQTYQGGTPLLGQRIQSKGLTFSVISTNDVECGNPSRSARTTPGGLRVMF